MRRKSLPLLHKDSFTYIGIRVAVRLIVQDYNRNSTLYTESRSLAILDLAQRCRPQFPALYGPLILVARLVLEGYSLADVRWTTVSHAVRSLHRRRPGR